MKISMLSKEMKMSENENINGVNNRKWRKRNMKEMANQ